MLLRMFRYRRERREPLLVRHRPQSSKEHGLRAERSGSETDRGDDGRHLLYQGVLQQIDERREDVGGDEWEEGIQSVIDPLYGFPPLSRSERDIRVIVQSVSRASAKPVQSIAAADEGKQDDVQAAEDEVEK